MSVLRHWIFICMALVASIIYILQRLGIALPWFVNNYLNDILSIPLTLFIILAIIRLCRGSSYLLSTAMISSVVLYYAIYFEYYLPQHNPRYTSDIFDVGCYAMGGVVFYLLQYRFLNKKCK